MANFRCPQCGGIVDNISHVCRVCGVVIKNLPNIIDRPPDISPPGSPPIERNLDDFDKVRRKKRRDMERKFF